MLAPLITLIPALLAVSISGPLIAEAASAGLKVSQLAQLLLIVLVLGAGTDYGLFLVFRVRENLRRRRRARRGRRADQGRRVDHLLRRDRDRRTAVAAVRDLPDLLVPRHTAGDRHRRSCCWPGSPCCPRCWPMFGRAAFWPSKNGAGTGGRRLGPDRWTRRPAAGHTARHRRPGLRRPVGRVRRIQAGGLRWHDLRAGRHRLAARHGAARQVLPQPRRNPTNLVYKLNAPVWNDPAVIAAADQQLAASGQFTGVTGPLNPAGITLTPAQFTRAAHRSSGVQPRCPPPRPPGPRSRWRIPGVPGDGAVRQLERGDDPVRDRAEGGRSVDRPR